MNGYTFSVTCPKCGDELEPTAPGTSDGFRTQAVAYCSPCRTTWRIAVELHDVQAQAINTGKLDNYKR